MKWIQDPTRAMLHELMVEIDVDVGGKLLLQPGDQLEVFRGLTVERQGAIDNDRAVAGADRRGALRVLRDHEVHLLLLLRYDLSLVDVDVHDLTTPHFLQDSIVTFGERFLAQTIRMLHETLLVVEILILRATITTSNLSQRRAIDQPQRQDACELTRGCRRNDRWT